MNTTQYETGPAPTITVTECLGDLIVKGWPEPSVVLLGERCDVDQKEKGLAIRSSSRLTLRVPLEANLNLEQVRGDLIVKGVQGEIQINEINGAVLVKSVRNLEVRNAYGSLTAKSVDGVLRADTVMQAVSARNCGELALGTVHGDVSARFIDGAFAAEEIHGDLSLRTVSRGLTVGSCAGDANLQNLGGTVQVALVAGDLRLTGGLAPGKHQLRSDGEIVLRWPADAPLHLEASGSRIRRQIPFDTVSESESEGTLVATLGDGETFLTLQAAGEILIRAYEEEEMAGAEVDIDFGDLSRTLSGLGETISAQLDTQLADMSARLAQFGPEFSQKMARKAELAVERALKRVEKAQERARQRYTPPPPPPPPRKASSDEQLKVLQMLEKGVISVEEATKLLEALEG